ncbi:MAG: PilT/PilU family type 4a pilus ATPase [Candidatus Sumerlaeia bacterium]|nr:PilT/PilU family type 4a pilus ATPase [Candidatus Sumerlaeia bacterium]
MPAQRLQVLLDLMIRSDASDLYLSAYANPKFSLHGGFTDAWPEQLTPDDTLSYAAELLSEEQREEFARELEINLSFVHGKDGRFRVNCFTQRGCVAIVIRRIKTTIPKFSQLNLPPILGRLITADRGLMLVTGATGSGKSTTLASMIDYRNETMGGHIITIEDPVEFVFDNKQSVITQREVGIDTKSFEVALKNTLRQAPRVIYIGEIRGEDTMHFALHAAETGHLVLATLHSTNANQTIDRIKHFFPADFHEQLLLQLSMNLRAIVSQRLVPAARGGRVPALEILINTPFIAELIQKGDIGAMKDAIAESRHEGLQTFDQHLLDLWKAGAISPEEALRNADSANNLRLRMRGVA